MTGREHLLMFGRLRGIQSNELPVIVDNLLERLGLVEIQHRQAGTYSGGNKRKLSTAIALIGDPPIVFLDEPTTVCCRSHSLYYSLIAGNGCICREWIQGPAATCGTR
jgi:ABC-type Na+ transport system ATPase subunit NatA